MVSDSLNTKNQPESLSSIFQWMPTCALIIDKNGIIVEVNEQAIRFFKASTQEDFIFDKQNIKNMIIDYQRANELIDSIKKNKTITDKEILLRRFDKTIASVDMNACTFPDYPNWILIQFKETFLHSQDILNELSQAYKREALRLKPYLNKPGKEALEQMIISNILDEVTKNKPTRNDQVKVVGEDRIELLTQAFPQLSNSEIVLCGYFSLKMSIENVAHLTGKTPNCLRVAFHRILRKTTYKTGKEFLRALETIK